MAFDFSQGIPIGQNNSSGGGFNFGGGTLQQQPINQQATSPTPTPSQSPSVGGFFGNILKSGLNLGGNILGALMHPIKTVENLGNTAVGAGEKIGEAITGTDIGQTPQKSAFDNLANYFKQSYGSPDAIMNKAYQDPVGLAVDISSFLTGGAGLLGKGGELAQVARLGEVGNVAKAGELTNVGDIAGATQAARGTGLAASLSRGAKTLDTASNLGGLAQAPGAILGGLNKIARAGIRGIKEAAPGLTTDAARTISTATPIELNQIEEMARAPEVQINPIVNNIRGISDQIAKKAGDDIGKVRDANINTPFQLDENALNNEINKSLSKYGGGAVYNEKTGMIEGGNFGRTQRNLLENSIQTIKEENSSLNTPQDLENLKKRLYDDVGAKLEPGPNEKKASPAKAIFSSIYRNLSNALPDELQAANKLYSQRMDMVNELNRLVPKTGPDTISSAAISRVKKLSNDEYSNLYGNLFDSVKRETGQDLARQVDLYNAAKELKGTNRPMVGGLLRATEAAAIPAVGQTRVQLRRAALSPVGQVAGNTIATAKNLAGQAKPFLPTVAGTPKNLLFMLANANSKQR